MEEVRRKYGGRIIGIFGSYARDEQSEVSDIDVLVEIGKKPSVEVVVIKSQKY